jgi:dTDP-4-dehydrorhamnose 3,5-epimerase-like enzyme
MAEVVRVEADMQPYLRLRSIADEVWVLIEGRVEFRWFDMRSDSPTNGAEHHFICEKATQVLAPFGVAFGYRPLDGPALLLRLATHADGLHDGDRRLAWEKTD